MREGPGANLAGIRPLTGMHPHVHGQLRPLIETGTTLTTPEGFFVSVFGMGAHMVSDVAFERFTTDVTFVKPFVLVKGQNMPF